VRTAYPEDPRHEEQIWGRMVNAPTDSDEFEEFTIPLETARGQKVALIGTMRTKLDDRTKHGVVHLLARALVAHCKKTPARWELVGRRLAFGVAGESAAAESSNSPQAPKVRAQARSVEGQRVFTMARAEWSGSEPTRIVFMAT
jgi:hypothetical protein